MTEQNNFTNFSLHMAIMDAITCSDGHDSVSKPIISLSELLDNQVNEGDILDYSVDENMEFYCVMPTMPKKINIQSLCK